MSTQRTLAANPTRKVPLRMLGNTLRRVYAVHDDGSFDDLIRRLDSPAARAEAN